jgi:2-haloacid dehalogenase
VAAGRTLPHPTDRDDRFVLNRHTHLLLDLDGTVLDFEESQRHALRDTVAELGLTWDDGHLALYTTINIELWEAYERREIQAGDLRRTRWARWMHRVGAVADPDEVGAYYLERFAAGAHLVQGALEAVAALARRMTVIAVTNGFGDVQRTRLARSGIDQYLSGLVVSDEVGHAKPHPAIFDAAFDIAGDPPRDRAAIVGDSLTSDIAGGRAYGITTIWVNPDGPVEAADPSPDHTIRSIVDLA